MERGKDGWVALVVLHRSPTLKVFDGLVREGFEVWIPIELEVRRVPRMNARRTVRKAALPGYVFARASHLWTLVAMSRLPDSPFRMFRESEGYPVISDDEFAKMQTAEKRALPKAQRPHYGNGAQVRATSGPYQGLAGTVKRCRKGTAEVMFGWHKVKISTFEIEADEPGCNPKPFQRISPGQAHQRITARKAA